VLIILSISTVPTNGNSMGRSL